MLPQFPGNDAHYNQWQDNLTSVALAHAHELNLDITKKAALENARLAWQTAFTDHLKAQTAAAATASWKESARREQEIFLRPLLAEWQENPHVSPTLRTALGMGARNEGRNGHAKPTTRPQLEADSSRAGQLTIHFRDFGVTTKAKPPGVRGCQFWVQIGGSPPVILESMNHVATDTRTPYVIQFNEADLGKTVYIIGRWESHRGLTGPMSEMLTVTIPG
jgi:hypothetical protein